MLNSKNSNVRLKTGGKFQKLCRTFRYCQVKDAIVVQTNLKYRES